MTGWDQSEAGGWLFRVKPLRSGSGFVAEAKRASQPFVAESAVYEPGDHEVFFNFAKTAERALSRVKAEVLN